MVDGNDGERSQRIFRPSYELTPRQIDYLSQRLLHERVDGSVTKHRFVTIEVAADSDYGNIGRTIEAPVFMDAFKEDPARLEQIYGPYENSSRFFISFDRHKREPTGALRVIENSAAGFMTFNVASNSTLYVPPSEIKKHAPLDDDDLVWDVGTIAVPEEYRMKAGGSVAAQLERAMYVSALKHGITGLVSILDHAAYRKLDDVGIPFHILAAGPFEGSELSYAVYGDAPMFEDSVRARRQAFRLQSIALGAFLSAGQRRQRRRIHDEVFGRLVGRFDDSIYLLDV